MSEHEESEVQERSVPVDQQTIRDAIVAAAEERHREDAERVRVERRQAREGRIQKRRTGDLNKARDRKAQNLGAVNESNARTRSHLSDAARSLRAALRAATETKLSRHSDEGRQQQRNVRSIQASMASLRGVGAGNFDETNFDVDLDLDVG